LTSAVQKWPLCEVLSFYQTTFSFYNATAILLLYHIFALIRTYCITILSLEKTPFSSYLYWFYTTRSFNSLQLMLFVRKVIIAQKLPLLKRFFWHQKNTKELKIPSIKNLEKNWLSWLFFTKVVCNCSDLLRSRLQILLNPCNILLAKNICFEIH